MSIVEQLTEPAAFHGEGPVWWSDWGELRYVDMLAGDVHRVDVATGRITAVHISDVVATMRPRNEGGMVAAVSRGFALIGDDWSVQELDELWSDPSIRMNEGGCDPDGRFYCGSMAYDMREKAGRLYRLDQDRSVSVVVDSVTVSNGLAWAPDGSVVYYADTATQRVDVFSYGTDGKFEDRRPFIRIEEGQGFPDGIAVDAEGYLWVALWRGGGVRRYAPDGRLDDVISLDVTQVTACTFGGTALDELFITTSRVGVAPGEEPEAGAVFRARPGVRGMDAVPYRG
jgi:sugar lactone lactonase YvrE